MAPAWEADPPPSVLPPWAAVLSAGAVPSAKRDAFVWCDIAARAVSVEGDLDGSGLAPLNDEAAFRLVSGGSLLRGQRRPPVFPMPTYVLVSSLVVHNYSIDSGSTELDDGSRRGGITSQTLMPGGESRELGLARSSTSVCVENCLTVRLSVYPVEGRPLGEDRLRRPLLAQTRSVNGVGFALRGRRGLESVQCAAARLRAATPAPALRFLRCLSATLTWPPQPPYHSVHSTGCVIRPPALRVSGCLPTALSDREMGARSAIQNRIDLQFRGSGS